jgi:hypothetical protein
MIKCCDTSGSTNISSWIPVLLQRMLKGGKSSRGHTCCQLFVTNKGFVYVVPMTSKGEVLQAVKQFTKEIGAPEAIIADPSGEQTSHALRQRFMC